MKHHIKFKSPKQDVIQTYATPKSTFYIARRIIQSNSDRAIKLLNYKRSELLKNQNQQTSSVSRVYTTVNYRSLSTTPTRIRGQFSQNIDLQSQGINTERHQTSSILSSDLLINSAPNKNRIVSLYQVSNKNQNYNTDIKYEEQGLSVIGYRSKSRINSIKSEYEQLNNIDNNLIDNTPIIMKKDRTNRKLIFQNSNYYTYSKMSQLQIKNQQQTMLKQQIYHFKILKNIKDFQTDQSELKQFRKKYSKVWKENFQLQQFQEQQQYQKSSQQFKLYFNQFIQKFLNKFQIYEQITLKTKWLKENQQRTLSDSGSYDDLRKMYINNHKLKCIQSKIDNPQFKYQQEIKQFGMTEILIELQEEEFNNYHSYQEEDQNKLQVKQLIYFQNESIKYPTNYKIYHVMSILDYQTKNKLLSVDYTDLDQLIYQNNIDEPIPQIQSENAFVRKNVSTLVYEYYQDILMGNYQHMNQLNDIENENYYEQQQQLISQNIDKKAMLLNLRRQTKEAKILGRRSVLTLKMEQQQGQNIFPLQKSQNKLTILKVPEQVFSRRKSKSMHSIMLSQNQEEFQNEDNNNNNTNQSFQDEFQPTDFYVKPIKYKQQMKLQNQIIFDQIIKKENSQIQLVQMMIEHNLFDELIDFLRQHPNFSLNSRNIEGKPFIMLAAQSGNVELVKYMINQNVPLNTKDLDGNTALHYSIALGYYKIADLLLQSGANPHIKNRSNQNAWSWNQQRTN